MTSPLAWRLYSVLAVIDIGLGVKLAESPRQQREILWPPVYFGCNSVYATSAYRGLGKAQGSRSRGGVVVIVVAKSCLPFATPWTRAPPGTSIHGISQAILEWVAVSFSRGSS